MKVTTDNKDNKYGQVLMMAQRVKQLHNGARARIAMPGSRNTSIAIEEVERQLIGFHHVIEPPQ